MPNVQRKKTENVLIMLSAIISFQNNMHFTVTGKKKPINLKKKGFYYTQNTKPSMHVKLLTFL